MDSRKRLRQVTFLPPLRFCGRSLRFPASLSSLTLCTLPNALRWLDLSLKFLLLLWNCVADWAWTLPTGHNELGKLDFACCAGRPDPKTKTDPKPTAYVVLRGPGIYRRVVVYTQAEFFSIWPRFTEDSLSHNFPSKSEARVCCLATAFNFPEQ